TARLRGAIGKSFKFAKDRLIRDHALNRKVDELLARYPVSLSPALTRLSSEYLLTRGPWLNAAVPWYTSGARSWLQANVVPEDDALEFGAGRSTLWWAGLVKSVTAVEASPDWTIWLLFALYERPDLLKRVRV